MTATRSFSISALLLVFSISSVSWSQDATGRFNPNNIRQQVQGGEAGGFDTGFDTGFQNPGGFDIGDTATVITETVTNNTTVLTGSRIQCKITRRLLEDVFYKEVPLTDVSDLSPEPKDDGEWPDLVAGDGIYSNWDQSDEYLSPEAHEVMMRIIRMIELAEELNPLEFYGVIAATTDPHAPKGPDQLPIYMEEEKSRDEKITEWADSFLKEYRKDPNEFVNNTDEKGKIELSNVNSEFWPLYVPRPPELPSIEMPEGFDPLYFQRPEEEIKALADAYKEANPDSGRTVTGPNGEISTTGDSLFSGPDGSGRTPGEVRTTDDFIEDTREKPGGTYF